MNAKGLAAAWLVGEALIIWRLAHNDHQLPVPGQLLGVSVLFAGFAIAADVFPRAGQVIVLTAWGLDVAGFLNLWPKGLGPQLEQAQREGEAG